MHSFLALLADLNTEAIDSRLIVVDEGSTEKTEGSFCGGEAEGELFLALTFETECANFALSRVQHQVLKKSLSAKGSSDILK